MIPAKASSRRLKNKNMTSLLGRPLLDWTIDIAKRSKIADQIYVSSENDLILNYAHGRGVGRIKRPEDLLGETPILDVYKHAAQVIKNSEVLSDLPTIIGMQPDHPDRKMEADAAFKIFDSKNLDELFTCDDLRQKNGSFYIVSKRVLDGFEGKRTLTVEDNCTNIHSMEDLQVAANILSRQSEYDL
ncbi:hypothetical protein OAN83_01960 [Alphaproteobacteria bacterium]|nr:hypothetical protein [Alphaproteobacteria bacterium]